MRSDQLDKLVSVPAIDVHPDGTWAVAATSRPSFAADSYVGQLWRVPLDGSGEPRRLTRGFADSLPRFSPDGSLIAFLRRAPGGKPQLHVVEAGGGEPIQLTDRHLGVSDLCFSPNGSRLAFVSREPADGRYGTVNGVDSGAEDPRHISEYQFMMNGVGYTLDKPAQVFLIDVPDLDGEPPVTSVGRAARAREADAPSELFPMATQLTFGPFDHDHPCFSAGGGALLVSSSRHEGHDADLVTDLYRIDVSADGEPAGEPTRLTNTGGGALVGSSHPCVVGSTVFFVGSEVGESGRDFVGRTHGIYRLDERGGMQRLTDAEMIDIAGAPRPGPSESVVAPVLFKGTVGVLQVEADGSVTTLLDREQVVVDVVGVPGGADVLVAYSDAQTTGDVARIDAGVLTALTDFSAGLRADTTIHDAQPLTASSPDGYPVEGWVLVPPGDGPHPVLLVIHGGPYAAYTSAFFDEAQTYVEAGYAVVMCNPRGSAGFGATHGRSIKDDMGNLDMIDILAFLDHALATVPRLDGERLGIMGGSYGGYMTAWIIGHDQRFKGAIVERGFLDPRSFVGSSDIGWFFVHEYNTADDDRMDAQSPMHLTSVVTTPTFVIHSEQDLRCPLSQALRYHAQLKLSGVDTELLIFPGENHELSRSGTPHHRKQRFDAILDWWGRHLPVSVRHRLPA